MLRILRFCCVGGIGFVTDTAILLAAVDLAGVPPLVAKALSFAIALAVTFELNRRWAFRDDRPKQGLGAFPAYVGVQGAGFLFNWITFTICLHLAPAPLSRLPVASIVAAIAALLLNYTGAVRFVFDRDGAIR